MLRIPARALRRSVAVFALTISGPLACSSYRYVGAGPAALERSAGAESLRVTLRDGSSVVLVRPVVSGDTLAGTRPGAPTEPVYIPTREVRTVEQEHFDVLRTAALIGGAYLLLVWGVARVYPT